MPSARQRAADSSRRPEADRARTAQPPHGGQASQHLQQRASGAGGPQQHQPGSPVRVGAGLRAARRQAGLRPRLGEAARRPLRVPRWQWHETRVRRRKHRARPPARAAPAAPPIAAAAPAAPPNAAGPDQVPGRRGAPAQQQRHQPCRAQHRRALRAPRQPETKTTPIRSSPTFTCPPAWPFRSFPTSGPVPRASAAARKRPAAPPPSVPAIR